MTLLFAAAWIAVGVLATVFAQELLRDWRRYRARRTYGNRRVDWATRDVSQHEWRGN